MLTLMAEWQAMEAAMRARACRGSRAGLGGRSAPALREHALQLAAFEADGRGLDGERARAEGLGFEAVALEFVGDLGEGDHLGGREVDEQRHEQTLAVHALDFALAQDFFEEHALVGDVLVDDPEAFFVGGEDERLAELADGFERGEGV